MGLFKEMDMNVEGSQDKAIDKKTKIEMVNLFCASQYKVGLKSKN